jgi:dTDP-glucose 4,6-dehydratase
VVRGSVVTKRVLLTGASGFVGSHTLRHLLINTDWDIVCPVSFNHKGLTDRINFSIENIDNALDRVTIVRGDLTAPVSAVTAHSWGKIDYVLNIASESHVDRSIENPSPFIINNVALMCSLLDWARHHDSLEKFVQISTDEVYGPAAPGHAHREWKDLHLPSNPYSASKAAQEDICFAYWRTYGIPMIVTNTMNIIGETQDPEKYVPLVVQKVLNGEKLGIHASITTGQIGSRYYLHARNQADGLLHVLKNVTPVQYDGDSVNVHKRFHIVGEIELDNLQLAEIIAQELGLPLNYELVDFNDSRPGHDLRYALDGESMADIGWVPPLPLEESLRNTVRWMYTNQEWLSL